MGHVVCVLPEGWFRASADEARRLFDELRRELPRDHVLHGVAVEAFAHRGGTRDDVLFRRIEDPARFVMVHLTWRGCTEVDARWPSVVFEGTFDEFLADDELEKGR